MQKQEVDKRIDDVLEEGRQMTEDKVIITVIKNDSEYRAVYYLDKAIKIMDDNPAIKDIIEFVAKNN